MRLLVTLFNASREILLLNYWRIFRRKKLIFESRGEAFYYLVLYLAYTAWRFSAPSIKPPSIYNYRKSVVSPEETSTLRCWGLRIAAGRFVEITHRATVTTNHAKTIRECSSHDSAIEQRPRRCKNADIGILITIIIPQLVAVNFGRHIRSRLRETAIFN